MRFPASRAVVLRPNGWLALAGVGLAIRIAYAAWNAWAGPAYGADADALTYHEFAVSVSQGESPLVARPSTYGFAYMLGLVYRLTGPSIFIGSLFSCAAWFLSALTLGRILQRLDTPARTRISAMAIYSLLPSSIIWTSATLRESYQSLLVNAIVLAALAVLARPNWLSWLTLLIAATLGVFLHMAVLFFGCVVVGLIVVTTAATPRDNRDNPWRMVTAVAIATSSLLAAFATTYIAYRVRGGLPRRVSLLIQAGLFSPARTVYVGREAASIDGYWDLVPFAALALWRYFVEPLPWHVSNLLDVGLLLENVLRGTLLVCSAAAVFVHRGRVRQMAVVALAAFVSLEAMWALGTFNWGTAARHHVPGWGVLLVGASLYFAPRKAHQA